MEMTKEDRLQKYIAENPRSQTAREHRRMRKIRELKAINLKYMSEDKLRRASRIVKMRYKRRLSLNAIGIKFGLSRERIRQILKQIAK